MWILVCSCTLPRNMCFKTFAPCTVFSLTFDKTFSRFRLLTPRPTSRGGISGIALCSLTLNFSTNTCLSFPLQRGRGSYIAPYIPGSPRILNICVDNSICSQAHIFLSSTPACTNVNFKWIYTLFDSWLWQFHSNSKNKYNLIYIAYYILCIE